LHVSCAEPCELPHPHRGHFEEGGPQGWPEERRRRHAVVRVAFDDDLGERMQ
jgi:hypothetical protein